MLELLTLLPTLVDTVSGIFKESPEAALATLTVGVSVPSLIFKYFTGTFLPKNKRGKFVLCLRKVIQVLRVVFEYSGKALKFLEEGLEGVESKVTVVKKEKKDV